MWKVLEETQAASNKQTETDFIYVQEKCVFVLQKPKNPSHLS